MRVNCSFPSDIQEAAVLYCTNSDVLHAEHNFVFTVLLYMMADSGVLFCLRLPVASDLKALHVLWTSMHYVCIKDNILNHSLIMGKVHMLITSSTTLITGVTGYYSGSTVKFPHEREYVPGQQFLFLLIQFKVFIPHFLICSI